MRLDWINSILAKKRFFAGKLFRNSVVSLLIFSIIVGQTGCAVVPYTFSTGDVSTETAKLAPEEPQFERGEPYWLLDGIGNYFFSLLSKLIIFNWKMENHDISPDTQSAMAKYIADNHLTDVKVRLNQYSPGDEWGRLVDNKAVGAGWRYTIGVLSWLGYTIFPGRLFGGDSYNPYTNTISLYSDIKAVGLHEAGHAKDFALTKWKGSYGVLGIIPFSSLYFEAKASGDAIGYLKYEENKCGEKEAYKVLYPAYGTYIGGDLTQFVNIFTPINALFSLAFVIPGHIVGRTKASDIEIPEGRVCTEGKEEAAPADTDTVATEPNSSGSALIGPASTEVEDKKAQPESDLKSQQAAEQSSDHPK